MVFHGLEDCVDGFLAKRVVLLCQRVCFINKQNASHSLLDLFLGLERSLSHISRHESGAVHLDELPLGEHADLLIEPADDPGDSCLAGSGISCKDQVKRYWN